MATIVVVQPHLVFGGAERQTVLLLNRLSELGHECHVVLHSAHGGLLGDLTSSVRVWDLHVPSHAGIPLAAIRLRRVLLKIPPAYVIIKLWSSILATAMIEKGLSKHTLNYCEDLDPDDHAEFIRFGKLKQALIGRIFRRAQNLTANTESVADKMRLKYKLEETPAVIPSTVDGDQIRRRVADHRTQDTAPTDAIRICSVGSLIERKGLRITAAALQEVAKERQIEWDVVGEGPMRDLLADLAGPQVKTTLHPGTSNPYPHMARSHVLVHSAVSEAFGIVIPEALSLGIPVIAAKAIGPAEIQARLGRRDDLLRVVTPSDPTELAGAILERVANPVPELSVFIDYVRPYDLSKSVDGWLRRAGAGSREK